MNNTQIFCITLVGIVGLLLIFFGLPSIPKTKSFNCEDIGAKYLHHGLCVKSDGSIWDMPKN